MKLIIQVPCFNEETTLPDTLGDLPREVEGFDSVEWLVIDDGSVDRTVEVAKAHGADHIVGHTANQGLARAFATGIDACLRLGADVIVNTDGDNQYTASYIPVLTEPILKGRADMVVGNRQVENIAHFSRLKIRLQKLGSWVVRQASNTDVPDATSGFRALSRKGALHLNVVSDFTYTLETLIQAGRKGVAISHVPVGTNEKLRESRLFGSIPSYVTRSVDTIIRIYTTYKPLRVFLSIGVALFLAGFLLGGRFLYFFTIGDSDGHVQSLLLAVLLMTIGFQTGLTGLLAELIANNRKLMEETLWRVREIEFRNSGESQEVRFAASSEPSSREAGT